MTNNNQRRKEIRIKGGFETGTFQIKNKESVFIKSRFSNTNVVWSSEVVYFCCSCSRLQYPSNQQYNVGMKGEKRGKWGGLY